MTEQHGCVLCGTAIPKDPEAMLEMVAEHFSDHAEVTRQEGSVRLKSDIGQAVLQLENQQLHIWLETPSVEKLQLSRTMLAEHLFYFAGDDALELTWSDPPPQAMPANLHEVEVVSTGLVTPHMLRVKFSCADVSPFVGGHMHVRLLVPPKGRLPVWPVVGDDGRIRWPEGEDALLVRIYTIRHVDEERGEIWIDFLQHPAPGIPTPGADFARDAQPGDRAALIGPGGGGIPDAKRIFLAGDEAALPAIARIAAEAPAGMRLDAIIEVEDEAEEQPISGEADIHVRWLHRSGGPAEAKGQLVSEVLNMIDKLDTETYIWVACEKSDVRDVRRALKAREHDRKKMYVAWYWERQPG